MYLRGPVLYTSDREIIAMKMLADLYVFHKSPLEASLRTLTRVAIFDINLVSFCDLSELLLLPARHAEVIAKFQSRDYSSWFTFYATFK